MTATAAQIAQVRRMTAEPTTTTYSDALIQGFIESCTVPDDDGLEPDDSGWEATYDLAAAAADIWEEKGASVASNYDYSADGGSFQTSQAHTQAMQMARYWRSKSVARARTVLVT